VGGRGPFGPLLEQVFAWEDGELSGQQAQPQRIQRMAAIYLEATQFADQVFSHVEARPN
jgi:EAL and modified HD-GYP domain-containing signal transduction protein